jgi:outer membrane receptor protein involved in Fe transport
VYEDERRRATLLLDASLEHRYPIGDTELVAGVEVRNLLNDRVYTVSDGDSGIEPGRQLWLTLGLDF